jgi:hypothetical protein
MVIATLGWRRRRISLLAGHDLGVAAGGENFRAGTDGVVPGWKAA